MKLETKEKVTHFVFSLLILPVFFAGVLALVRCMFENSGEMFVIALCMAVTFFLILALFIRVADRQIDERIAATYN